MWYYPFDDGIIPHDEWSGLFQNVSVEITYIMCVFKKVKQKNWNLVFQTFMLPVFQPLNVTFITVESVIET